MEEIFKDIEGYEQLYQISNLGRVKSLNYRHTGKEKILKQKTGKDGYCIVGLCQQNKRKFYYVHRLVGQAFIENPNNYPMVNHKDENKENNCVSNIEWCDAKYNTNYGTAIERRVEKLSKPVMCIETGEIYSSTRELERQLGFGQGNISQCCNGKRKTAYGHTWRYVE